MMKVHGRKILDGDIANFSIGQGDVLVTPLQMAQAMAAVGNGGTLYQPRLVKQVQSSITRSSPPTTSGAEGQLGYRPEDHGGYEEGDGGRGLRPHRHRGQGRRRQSEDRRQDRHRPMGPEEQGARRRMVRRLRPGGQAEIRLRRRLRGRDRREHARRHYAAPMIAEIMEQLFKKEPPKDKKAAVHPRRKASTPVPETND